MNPTLTQYQAVKIAQTDDFISILPDYVSPGNTLLVTSQGFVTRGVAKSVVEKLGASRVMVFSDVTPNPEKFNLQTSVGRFMNSDITNVIALGGGSVIDAAKVFCAVLSHPDLSLDDLLTQKEVANTLNLIAIPSTSGTGAEVTPFATVWQSDIGKKHSVYGVRPNVAILDPLITLSLSKAQTLYPALDALSHGIESLWNKHKTKTSQRYALEAIERILAFLERALATPTDKLARANLQEAATLAGMAIAITKTAIAHALSYPLTARHGVPHGLACSFTLPGIIDVVGSSRLGLPQDLADKVKALIQKVNVSAELEKYTSWSQILKLCHEPMDPSRAGNFIGDIDAEVIEQILRQSQLLLDRKQEKVARQ